MKPGDLVMLVWACCEKGRKHLGWIGDVESIETFESSACFCGHITHGIHAWIDIDGKGVVPISWLIKIEPKEKVEDTTKELEMMK